MPSNQARKRRILVVANGAIGVSPKGQRFINKHTSQFLADLKRLGLHPSYIGPAAPYDNKADLLDSDLVAMGIDSVVLESSSIPSKIRGLVALARALVWSDLAYIFYPGKLGGLVARLLALMGKPYGLYVRGMLDMDSAATLTTLRGARFILTVSPSLAREVGPYCTDAVQIRPMVDLSPSDAVAYPDRSGGAVSWRLLFVGNILPDKGIYELVDAMAELVAGGVDVHLTMVGAGAHFHELQARIDSLGIGPHVHMTGLVSDKAALMALFEQADMFVLPTYHEGFPRVLYEAMIKSRPIITTLVGGIGGRMTDGVNCLAIPARQSAPIAAAVRHLIDNPGFRREIAEAGHQTTLSVLTDLQDHASLVHQRAVPHNGGKQGQ